MKAIVITKPGDESVLALADVPAPVPAAEELLIRVRAAALNRADIMQRQGFYPPPPGASELLGLECAGEIERVGANVKGWTVGDRVMALLPGGGYAEKAVVHQGSALRVPAVLSDEEAAALPEVYLTAFLNLFMLADTRPGESVLVHGGGSGVGTASINLLKVAGARSIVTAGSDAKCAQCLKFGADVAINYKTGSFVDPVRTATSGRGADVILDSIGAGYLAQNVESLGQNGRLVLIGLMRGTRAEIDLAALLRRHIRIIGSTLRSRSAAEKASIVAAFLARFGKDLEAGHIKPAIDRVLPLAEAAQAHRIMQASEHFGKVVLSV